MITSLIIIVFACANEAHHLKIWEVKPSTATSVPTTGKVATKCTTLRRRDSRYLVAIWSLIDSAQHNKKDLKLRQSVMDAGNAEIERSRSWLNNCQGEDPDGAIRVNHIIEEVSTSLRKLSH